jgi:hypothetical protein
VGDFKGGKVMSKKDYIKTSNILRGFSQEIHPQVFEDMVDLFCDWFQSDNENFDKAKFEKACGVDELGLIDA